MVVKENSFFYVNPMGYKNLGQYDASSLSNVKKNVHYFTSIKFDNQNLNLPTYKIYSYTDKNGVKKILSYFYSQLILLKKIIQIRPKAIHFQWLKVPQFDYLLILLLKLFGTKIVFTAHNILPHDSENKFKWIFGSKLISNLV